MTNFRSIAMFCAIAIGCLATTACVITPPRARVVHHAPGHVWIPAHWQHGVWVRGHWR